MTISIATKQLPAVVRNLIKSVRHGLNKSIRPRTVDVMLHGVHFTLNESFRTVELVGVKPTTGAVDSSWVGSDGENNHRTTHNFDCPVIEVRHGFPGLQVIVHIPVEGNPVALETALQDVDAEEALSVAVDAWLAKNQ